MSSILYSHGARRAPEAANTSCVATRVGEERWRQCPRLCTSVMRAGGAIGMLPKNVRLGLRTLLRNPNEELSKVWHIAAG